MDLQRVTHLKILVALRTNIFEQLGFDRLSGGQEEKLLAKTLVIRWTKNDLRSLLNRRAEAACEYYEINPPKRLNQLLPTTDEENKLAALTYILNYTLMKPRDAITFLNYSVREAAGTDRITWKNIKKAEHSYSQSRLNALRDEWKDPYLGIERVFKCFFGSKSTLNRTDLSAIFDKVAELIYEDDFLGTTWLTPYCEKIWEIGDDPKKWVERYGDLVTLLHHITFLGIIREGKNTADYAYIDKGYEVQRELMKSTNFEVHKSFRLALNIPK